MRLRLFAGSTSRHLRQSQVYVGDRRAGRHSRSTAGIHSKAQRRLGTTKSSIRASANIYPSSRQMQLQARRMGYGAARRLGLGEQAPVTSRPRSDLSSDQDIVSDALQSYHYATMLDPKWYKAWHAWALANTEVVSHYMKTRSESDTNPIPQAMYTDFLVPAVRGISAVVCYLRSA